jgi:signal transduction histidine kinase
MRGVGQTQGKPRFGELVSLAERMAYLRILRIGFVSIVIATCTLAPEVRGASLASIAAASAAYLLLLPAPELAQRLRRKELLPVIGGTLMVDGIYLGWVAYATGGAQSPLRFLVYLHVVAVTLLASYRTGLKIAAWHSLLLFAAFYAQSAGILEVRETILSALPGRGADFQTVSMLNVAALWAVALGTAAFSALSERELRAQKVGLEQTTTIVSDLDKGTGPSHIPLVLLNSMSEIFGFRRGAVLTSSPQEEVMTLVAYRGDQDPGDVPEGPDPVMERAWNSRTTQLVREVDPAVDWRLAKLLPGGRNLLVVPLFLDGGYRMGILVLEWPADGDTIKRWIVAMVEQCAAHAALALHKAWLVEDIEQKLEEIRSLEMQLFAQNVDLERTVEERTEQLRESLEALRTLDLQRQRLLSRLVNAEEEERRRVAREILDGPVQNLATVTSQLKRLHARLRTIDADAVEAALDRVEAEAGDSLVAMRRLIVELRPVTLDEEGLAAALDQYANGLNATAQVSIDNRLKREPPDETRLTLYRITQEALVNTRRHAQAANVAIHLEEAEGGFLARIRDDGVGFSPPGMLQSGNGHLGLSFMRERAEMAGGRCEVLSLPGKGTMVEVWVPDSEAGDSTSLEASTSETAETPESGPLPLRAVM